MPRPARLTRTLPLALALAGLALALPAPAADAADRRCTPVDGRQTCLRLGHRCDRRHRGDHLQVGLDCRRRRGRFVLVAASEAALRGPEFARLRADGLPSFETALQAFEQVVADLPGVRPRPGVIGEATSGTLPMLWLTRYRNRLTPAQRAVLDRAASPGRGRKLVARAAQTWEASARYMSFIQQARTRLEAHGLVIEHPVRLIIDRRRRRGRSSRTQAAGSGARAAPATSTSAPVACRRSTRRDVGSPSTS